MDRRYTLVMPLDVCMKQLSHITHSYKTVTCVYLVVTLLMLKVLGPPTLLDFPSPNLSKAALDQ